MPSTSYKNAATTCAFRPLPVLAVLAPAAPKPLAKSAAVTSSPAGLTEPPPPRADAMDYSHVAARSSLRYLVLEPAMGFGRARLVMAPAAARFPAGVHAIEGVVVPAATTGSRSGPALRISAAASRRQPTVTRATGFLVAPVAAGSGRLLDSTVAAAVAGSSSSSATGRRGVVAIGVASRDFYPEEEEDDDDDSSDPADLFNYNVDVRSKKHIAAWVELARLQTTFEVAFDAGVLKSGSDLRRVLDVIGTIDLTAPSRPWGTELCHDRINDIIGAEMLQKLLGARTPKDDEEFVWSALAAQSMIEGIEKLVGVLVDLLHEVPKLPICSTSPVILKQLLKVLSEFSIVIESTKFRRPQNTLKYRLFEAHALALEHTCAIALDVYEEIFQDAPQHKWTDLRQQVMNRRITLFEQDMGLKEYTISTGLTDTEDVYELVEKVILQVYKKRASRGTG